MTTYTATYSPQDNKIRISASNRLDPETYATLKEAGYKWAPKQEQFIAPLWTPAREDIAIELAGIIDDEDSTLEERAKIRAERFENYSVKRASEAESTYNHVNAIAGNIPFGQPILIGHHSQRKAERDAQRIEDGMRKTVKLWETSSYWTDRAQSSLAHARYKELDSVRFRRRKGLQADMRGFERNIADLEKRQASFLSEPMTEDRCKKFYKDGKFVKYNYKTEEYELLIPLEEIITRSLKAYEVNIQHYNRWLNHTNNRIAYETAMLNGYDEVTIRRKPENLPLVNYPSEGFLEMTKEEWKKASARESAYVTKMTIDHSEYNQYHDPSKGIKAAYRQRVQSGAFYTERYTRKYIFITDLKVTYPPKADEVKQA
jgi:hypothetical protein